MILAVFFVSLSGTGAVIKNLTVSGKISTNNVSTNISGMISSRCVDGATIENCIAEGSIYASPPNYNTGLLCFGGICGYLSGDQSTITNCKSYVNMGYSNCDYDGMKTGGIVGFITNNTTTQFSCNIMYCDNYGSVENGMTGGIVGEIGSRVHIYRCRNFGKVYGHYWVANTASYEKCSAGGIAGRVLHQDYGSSSTYRIIEECANYGDVSASIDWSGTSWAGGILGGHPYNYSDSTKYQWFGAKIINCYNAGTVNGIAGTTGSNTSYAGGAVGRQISSNVTNFFNYGSVTAKNGVADSYSDDRGSTVYGTCGDGVLKTREEMSTQEFVDILNLNAGKEVFGLPSSVSTYKHPRFLWELKVDTTIPDRSGVNRYTTGSTNTIKKFTKIIQTPVKSYTSSSSLVEEKWSKPPKTGTNQI